MEGTAWRVKYCSIFFMRLYYTASTIYSPEKTVQWSVILKVSWAVFMRQLLTIHPACFPCSGRDTFLFFLVIEKAPSVLGCLVLYNMHEKRKKGCNEPRKQKSFFFFFYTRSRYARHRLFPLFSLCPFFLAVWVFARRLKVLIEQTLDREIMYARTLAGGI